MKRIGLMMSAPLFMCLLSSCVTYLGKPDTPAEDRAELAFDIGIMMYQFDGNKFDVPLQGSIIFDEGRHVLFIKYSTSRGASGAIMIAETGITKIEYTFERGKKYRLRADIPRNLYFGIMRYSMEPAE